MTEAQITRKQVIVVDKTGQNTYGDLTFSDKEGKQYKISTKRKRHFDGIITPGNAVQLNYSVFKDKEYIYSAESVAEKIDFQEIKDTSKIPLQPKIEPGIMTKVDWDEKDRRTRKSIERQKALELAVSLTIADKLRLQNPGSILGWAELFESYLESGYKEVRSALVKKAKKLGATEIKKEAD